MLDLPAILKELTVQQRCTTPKAEEFATRGYMLDLPAILKELTVQQRCTHIKERCVSRGTGDSQLW